MLSAKINKSIVVQELTTTRDSIGAAKPTWSDLYDLYAGILVLTGDVRFATTGQLLIYRTEFTVRKTKETEKITSKHRIKFNGDSYKIITIQPLDKTGYKITTVNYENG